MEDNNSNTVSAATQVSPATTKEDDQQVREAGQDCGGGTVEAYLESDHIRVSSRRAEITVKRKRGRPRKFDHHHHHHHIQMDHENTMSNVSPSSSNFLRSCEKRGRGRPRGSGRLQLLAALGGFAAETAGGILIPHVITVNTGEDIVSKISSFAQRGPRAVCVLSATGVVSCVIIRQPGSSGGLLRCEGHFEILSLSGSFTFRETSTARRKIGVLSVTLAKPDGQVFGGGVVGSLIASGPIQLIVASFKQNISKELKLRQSSESSTCSVPGNTEMVRVPIQIVGITDGGGDQENCTPTSPVVEPRNAEAENTIITKQHMKPVPQNGSGQTVVQSPQQISDEKVSPDINVSVAEI
ncbi:AT-hook motif nuclear-localized protein 9 [Ricinus communis]|uniref:AT-hook motif nuclear-localized protein n=1 Tax=Ricinus communis TaxID=3988 RepID=B9SN72_RICCO|nr:AT-hook motif nuclear-localized protein 9 [Ricinus communis]EEF34933.1 DNA binding protein, putative [Ricinus communis]|eukprot:XP_002527441.1 AT-hook motif nuclear-localized protein 9 [Ricinus communis]